MNKKGQIFGAILTGLSNPTLWITALAIALGYILTQGVLLPIFIG